MATDKAPTSLATTTSIPSTLKGKSSLILLIIVHILCYAHFARPQMYMNACNAFSFLTKTRMPLSCGTQMHLLRFTKSRMHFKVQRNGEHKNAFACHVPLSGMQMHSSAFGSGRRFPFEICQRRTQLLKPKLICI